MLETKRSRVGVVLSLVLAVLLLGTGAWLFFNRQYVIDQMAFWGYQPTGEVAELVQDIDLSPKGEFYFYVTHPSIESAERFNVLCPQREVNNPILGCYDGERIFIYDIKEESLDGIKQVTAAHEMLHAAWDRLNQHERDQVIELLKREYESISNTEFHERMDYYERTEPGEFYNELHSIIATERSAISEELEDYYRRYFDDRQIVVAFHDEYSGVFEELEKESDKLYETLVSVDKQISTKEAEYNRDLAALTADIENFNYRADTNQFASNQQFYNERAVLLVRTDQLELKRMELNALIEEYNKNYYRYEEVAGQIQKLNDSIDSMSTVPAAPGLER